jgi:hypothetical protein
MALLLALIVAATARNGLLAGLSFDGALVKLPAGRRIGAVAYAIFARGNDLGNGLWVYPATAISAAVLTIVAAIVAYVERASATLLVPLSIAALMSIAHFLTTSRAAPIMAAGGQDTR